MKSVVKVFNVLETILDQPGLRQTNIMKLTGLSRVEVHRCCSALLEVEWIENGSGKYFEGPKVKHLLRGSL
jgi:DNA-binding IclR family transcriptional regulator